MDIDDTIPARLRVLAKWHDMKYAHKRMVGEVDAECDRLGLCRACREPYSGCECGRAGDGDNEPDLDNEND